MLLIASLIMWTSMFTGILASETRYLAMEAKIIGDLEAYVEEQESVLQMLRKRLLTFKVEHSEALRDGDKYFSSELNKFRLIKRLASDIGRMASSTFEAANKFKSLISRYESERALPTEVDLRQSSLKMAQMQSVHKLRTDKTVRGSFFGGSEHKRTSLSADECFEIGKQLNSAEMYAEASEWLKEALKRHNEYYDLHRVSVDEISEELALSHHQGHRMDSSNQIVPYIMSNSSHASTTSDLCRPAKKELWSFLTLTCPT